MKKNVAHSQEKNQSVVISPQRIQILELLEKDFL